MSLRKYWILKILYYCVLLGLSPNIVDFPLVFTPTCCTFLWFPPMHKFMELKIICNIPLSTVNVFYSKWSHKRGREKPQWIELKLSIHKYLCFYWFRIQSFFHWIVTLTAVIMMGVHVHIIRWISILLGMVLENEPNFYSVDYFAFVITKCRQLCIKYLAWEVRVLYLMLLSAKLRKSE